MDTELVVGWICGLAMVALVVGVPTACTVHSDNLKAEAIRNGADPIAADCAFSSSSQTVPCALAAARLQQAQFVREGK